MLRENLQNALKEAMKNHDTATVSAVRLIIAGQKEKDVAARGAGKECASDADLLSMMQGMIKQRNESIKIYTEGGRPELAAKEQAEISIIERFLPKQLSEAETKAAIEAAIAKTGAAGVRRGIRLRRLRQGRPTRSFSPPPLPESSGCPQRLTVSACAAFGNSNKDKLWLTTIYSVL